ncbi:MAG TPA: protein translocase subunit SecD [Gaiellaceae bacterium]|nr:protein translocase subunit SecD [Gaiellaceae bacterium]
MRDRNRYLILVGVIIAALVGAVMLAVPGSPIYKKPTLGLDLQGGLEVILQAQPAKGQQITTAGMTTAQNVIRNRIDKLGVSEPEVRTQGTNQIVVQLAGVHDPAKAAALIGKTAQLLMFDFEADLASPTINTSGQPTPQPTLYGLLSQIQSQVKGSPEAYYLFRVKTVKVAATKKVTTKVKGKKVTKLVPIKKTKVEHDLLQGPSPTLKDLLRPYGGKTPKDAKILKTPGNRLVVSCPVANGCPGAGAAGTSSAGVYYYLFKYMPNAPNGPPELTGKDLVESGIRPDVDPTTGLPDVDLQFTGHGSHEFQAITKAEYTRGQIAAGAAGQAGNKDPTTIQTYAQHNAIVLDNVLESTPYIDYTDGSLSQGIAGNAVINMGSGGQQAAKDLALVLQTGSLPYTFKQIERTDVSATLGKNSLTQAWHAALVGLIVVAIFLLVLYRFLGLVAVFGLAIYAALYYAAILLFGVTLTLPGFAGLILTIGVAADANVVVFERIKEEVRAGKSVRAAIAAGYGKGFHTILDANAVTAITAVVLFLIAVADVKGFALMLLIGTLISLLTAVAATRALLGLLAGFRWFDNPRFMGAHGQQTARWLQIDFMKRRYVWFALSGVVILAGVAALGIRGLNLGIDFKGGTQISFKTHTAYTQSHVASVVSQDGYADAVVQGRGASSSGGAYKEWQVRTRSLKGAAQTNLTQSLNQELGSYGVGTKNVSASFGHQIAIDAIYGIIVSLILVVLYVALRFDFKFALPVILAMIHDILITIGVYSIFHREVSIDTVAAVLTVLGYSIYDTIIIFDRIRENVPLMRRQPFATIANVSLWETIRRSLATTFITLLPIIALEILGGATLKDFAFALLVGVTSGAYSSIFIAAPLLTIWKEREPEYAKRKGASMAIEGEIARRLGRLRGVDPTEVALEESEAALAAEPTPELRDAVTATPSEPGAQARRDKRRQRRRSRPHGRAR